MCDSLAEIDANKVENFSNEREGKIFFNKKAPRLVEISPFERRNECIEVYDDNYKGYKSLSEEEAIEDLKNFLDRAKETFNKYPKKNDNFANSFFAFYENVCFIGHKELDEAIDSISERWLELAKKGYYLFLYQAGVRSERWMAIQVLRKIEEKLAALPPEEAQDLVKRINFSARLDEIARKIILEKNENWRIIVLDDVRISGARSDGMAYNVIRFLEKNGLDRETTASRMEIDLVATRDKPCLIDGHQIPIYSHFICPSYENAPFGGSSFTGWWRTTDYGFGEFLKDLLIIIKNIEGDIKLIRNEIVEEEGEEILNNDDRYQDVLRRKTEEIEEIRLPALARIRPPYETDQNGRYLNPKLQKEWEQIGKYAL